MSPRTGAGAYASVGVESSVLTASPHQLINMLFEGAGVAIRTAGIHMQAGHTACKGEAISRALDIVNNGLLAELDVPTRDSKVCQGTLLSRAQYLVDLDEWGYEDARLAPRGTMSAQQIENWTAAIDKSH